MKVFKTPKFDVDTLSEAELKRLADLGSHKGWEVLEKIVSSSIDRNVKNVSNNIDIKMEDVARHMRGLAAMRNAWAYLKDAPQRAAEKLKDVDK